MLREQVKRNVRRQRSSHLNFQCKMVAVCTKHPNVYIDTSAYTVKRYPAALVAYLSGHGRNKVLFGTNWPMIAPKKALDGLDALGLEDEARDLFLAGNAIRVFGLNVAR